MSPNAELNSEINMSAAKPVMKSQIHMFKTDEEYNQKLDIYMKIMDFRLPEDKLTGAEFDFFLRKQHGAHMDEAEAEADEEMEASIENYISSMAEYAGSGFECF